MSIFDTDVSKIAFIQTMIHARRDAYGAGLAPV